MDDRTLYATILAIAPPWDVIRVELDDLAKAVHVWLEERAGTTFACPECQTIAPLHDHVERRWRHLDTCQYETQLHARVPRVHCATHGVKTVPVPWLPRIRTSRCCSSAWRSRG
jgi:transposase